MIKRITLSVLLIINLLVVSPAISTGYVFAVENTVPPAPTIEPAPSIEAYPTRPPQPTLPPSPTPFATTIATPTPPPTPTAPPRPTNQQELDTAMASISATNQNTTGGTALLYGNNSSLTTGNASSNGGITNFGNTNVSTWGAGGTGGTGNGVTNNGNGAASTNNGSTTTNHNNANNQNNGAGITNDYIGFASTGSNFVSYGNGISGLVTGDANVSGTILNGINTNVFGNAEFTVAGSHVGDIVLLAPNNTGTCTATCVPGNLSAKNNGNGVFSDNNATNSANTNTTTSQGNNADVVNNLTLTAVSGKNDSSYNVGDSSITTGDANAAGTILNAINTNVAGGGLYVINVVGDLVGDIILPVVTGGGCCGGNGNGTVANANNGAFSSNNASNSSSNTNTTTQANAADIQNNVHLNGNTGENMANFNTGDNGVETGKVSLSTKVVNVSNINVADSDSNEPIWIVLVNNMGEWTGRILGGQPGATAGATGGIQLAQNSDGSYSSVNSGNGAASNNNASNSTTNSNTTSQSNTAKIVNNVNIDADTGHNTAGYNTGGATSIKTGDIKGAVNIVNFINSNFAGRPVYVAIVNVFGKWIGNVVDKPKAKTTASSNTSTAAQPQQPNPPVVDQNQAVTSITTPLPTPASATVASQAVAILGVAAHLNPFVNTTISTGNTVSTAEINQAGNSNTADTAPGTAIQVAEARTPDSVTLPLIVMALLLPVASMATYRKVFRKKV